MLWEEVGVNVSTFVSCMYVSSNIRDAVCILCVSCRKNKGITNIGKLHQKYHLFPRPFKYWAPHVHFVSFVYSAPLFHWCKLPIICRNKTIQNVHTYQMMPIASNLEQELKFSQ